MESERIKGDLEALLERYESGAIKLNLDNSDHLPVLREAVQNFEIKYKIMENHFDMSCLNTLDIAYILAG